MPTANKSDRDRRLARVHIAKKKLGMDEESYRAMLVDNYEVDSAGKLDPRLLGELVASLERDAGTGARAKQSYPGRPNNMEAGERKPHLAKVEALLADMALPWNYANRIAKQMFRVERVEWLELPVQRAAIITALVKEARRRIAQFEKNKSNLLTGARNAIEADAKLIAIQAGKSLTAKIRICPGGPHGRVQSKHSATELRVEYDAPEMVRWIETYERRDPATAGAE